MQSPSPLDAQWCRRISPHITELFLVLGPLHAEIEHYRKRYDKQPFNPDMRPQHLDGNVIMQSSHKLEVLLTQIQAEETNQYVKQAYALKIDELLQQNQLLIDSLERNSVAFMEVNRRLYGHPKVELFSAACSWIRQLAADAIDGTDSPLRQAAEQVLRTLPAMQDSPRAIIPASGIFTEVRTLHWREGGFFDQLFGDAMIPDFVTPDIGDPITMRAIQAVGSTYTLTSSTDELWGVVHSRQQVVRPNNYSLPRDEFIGIVAHEVGSHLAERVNGEAQPLRLLAVGLDKYELSNEGRAFLREQIVYRSPYEMLQQSSWEYIVLLYIAAALGAGVYQKPYSFQELYDSLYPVCLLFQTKRQPDNPVYAKHKAHDETWQLVVRVTKGTDGTGGAYLKALVYLDGNVQAWRVAEEQPELLLFGDVGKFDIDRQDHLDILRGLHILKPVK